MTNQSNKTVLLGAGRRVGAAGLVRCVAGLPAGWGANGRSGDSAGRPGARRGSSLILIIGALALLSVVILSYFLIGKGDRRTAAVAVRKENIDGSVERIRDYFAGDIIANDVFSMYVDGFNFDENGDFYSYVVREAWDHPWTDPQRRSQPASDPAAPLPGTPEFDRMRFDPCGTMPRSFAPANGPNMNKILAFPGSDPFLATLAPTWLNPGVDAPRYDNNPAAYDSWLENRRDWAQITNAAPDGRVVNLYNLRGNFDAASGFTANTNGVGDKISDNLTLMDADGQSPYALGNQMTDYGVKADANHPSDWTTRQQSAFRPVGSAGFGFNDPRFPDYQWADTDGDGLYDSRYFELVDATDPNNPVSLMPKDGRFRWFVAARFVDLSGLVNVNVASDTALDKGGDPAFGVSDDYRVGMTPSDVELRNLLTLAAPKALYNLPDKFDAYNPLKQPAAFGGPDDYRNYANDTGATIFNPVYVGADGYNGIATTIGQILTPAGDQDLSQLQPLRAKERYDYYRLSGGFLPGEAGFLETNGPTDSGTLTGLFGLPDLIELLTYRGVNDPVHRSRLENAVGGRYITDPNNQPPHPEYSPLRDNRSLSVERSRGVDAFGYDQADLETLMWSALDIRQLLTTLSGARPLRSVRLSYDTTVYKEILKAGNELNATANELPTDAVAALRAAGNNLPARLFRGYCDTLLPFSSDPEAWDPVGTSSTLSYGYDPAIATRSNPETALRIAAAMTANQTDLYDTDSTPSAHTLLIDGSAANRAAVAADTASFPWWAASGLDLDNGVDAAFGTRLSDNAANNVTTKALNVFGIEAQPFVTEVATFEMYTDSPTGDNDYGDGVNTKPVTINGNIVQGNPDFIFQCIAFQLNNPFDEPVDLAGYHIAVGRFHTAGVGPDAALELVGLDPVNGGKVNVILQPHESRTFYIMSQRRPQILARMKVVDPSVDVNAPYPTSVLDQWVANQLSTVFINPGANPDAIEVPNSNDVIPFSVKYLMAGAPGALNEPGNREFRLWRPLPGPGNMGLLVDRIRDPQQNGAQRPTLDSRLKNGQTVVGGTASKNKNQDDDTGYTITTWAYIRRADDRGDPDQGNTVPKRALPAWTVEAKFGTSLNDRDHLPNNLNNLNKGTFTNTSNASFTFNGLITDQAFGTPGSIKHQVPTIQTNAEEKYAKFNGGPDANTMPANAAGVPFDRLYAEPHLDNNQFRNADGRTVLRPADLLLALGVGPSQDPKTLDIDPNDPGKDHPGWTTLGESLAMALGYDNPPKDADHAPIYNLYGKTDRGSLSLDKFVPFWNNDGDVNFIFDPTDPLAPDVLRGNGIPLALNIFDVFTTLDPQFGSLNRPTVGVINLNTAPEEVMRTEPMLSPPDDVDLIGYPQFFWPGGPLSSANTDIAATIAAYRDKTRIVPRANPLNLPFGQFNINFVGDMTGIPGYYNPDPNAAKRELFGRGRDDANKLNSPTGIQAIREQPGFMTKGEVLAARDLQRANPGTPTPSPDDIDKLGYDRPNNPGFGSLDKAGVDSVRYVNSAEDDQIQDDYDEKLAIANGMMNSISVRSDIFAATFIVHGYQKSDCQGLTDRDPLVPSVARRYLMIVDRSNVVRTGDKPRILVFKELPLK